MNENDFAFLRGMMLERMTYHLNANKGEDLRCSRELEEQLTSTLDSLPKEKAEIVQRYLEYLFERSAKDEEMYYRCALADGYKLCLLIREKLNER